MNIGTRAGDWIDALNAELLPPADAAVIRRERRAYYWRTAAIAACCTVAAVTVQGYGSWLPRIILLPELPAATVAVGALRYPGLPATSSPGPVTGCPSRPSASW